MISRKYFHYVFVAIMAMSMTLVLSFFATLGQGSFSAQFVMLWLSSAAQGFSIAFPTALLASPIASCITEKLTKAN